MCKRDKRRRHRSHPQVLPYIFRQSRHKWRRHCNRCLRCKKQTRVMRMFIKQCDRQGSGRLYHHSYRYNLLSRVICTHGQVTADDRSTNARDYPHSVPNPRHHPTSNPLRGASHPVGRGWRLETSCLWGNIISFLLGNRFSFCCAIMFSFALPPYSLSLLMCRLTSHFPWQQHRHGPPQVQLRT